jgi:hypothetical protein
MEKEGKAPAAALTPSPRKLGSIRDTRMRQAVDKNTHDKPFGVPVRFCAFAVDLRKPATLAT